MADDGNEPGRGGGQRTAEEARRPGGEVAVSDEVRTRWRGAANGRRGAARGRRGGPATGFGGPWLREAGWDTWQALVDAGGGGGFVRPDRTCSARREEEELGLG